MKSKIIFTYIFCLIFLGSHFAFARERCIMCGMDALKSETKVVIQVIKGTKQIRTGKYSLCCLHCFIILKDRIISKGGKIGSILVRDYNTVTDKYDSGEMIAASKGFYLVESALRPKGSMVPFMLIFSTKKTAETFKQAYGGRILNWEEVLKYTESFK